MIIIKKKANKVIIKGHAKYQKTNDIVCASVSSIMYTTVNAILRFDAEAISYNDDGNKVEIDILKNDFETTVLITNMMSLFIELAKKYKKNIKVESEE